MHSQLGECQKHRIQMLKFAGKRSASKSS
jgi:hypothetical protein